MADVDFIPYENYAKRERRFADDGAVLLNADEWSALNRYFDAMRFAPLKPVEPHCAQCTLAMTIVTGGFVFLPAVYRPA